MTEFVHDNLKYEINEWGNVRSMSIFYEKENKKYIVSVDLYDFWVSDQYARLEVTKRSRNPLKNIFGDKVLAYAKTPVDTFTISVWGMVRNKELKYPKDERFHGLIDLALDDIKKHDHEIEKDVSFMIQKQREEKEQAKARKQQEEAATQESLKKKNKPSDIDLINSIINERK